LTVKGRIEGTRELVFPGLPYIVITRVKGLAVEIARIYHAAQDWP
jgi:toxin ParE1/3/4